MMRSLTCSMQASVSFNTCNLSSLVLSQAHRPTSLRLIFLFDSDPHHILNETSTDIAILQGKAHTTIGQ